MNNKVINNNQLYYSFALSYNDVGSRVLKINTDDFRNGHFRNTNCRNDAKSILIQ